MTLWPGAESLRKIDVPQSDVGAPIPHVLADDYRLALAYRIHVTDPDWDGTTVRLVDGTEAEHCAVAATSYVALRFGPPNDEAIHGHRLTRLGLRPYAAFEVDHSAWIAEMEEMNRVHSNHRIERYRELRHFVFMFHDSMFEVVTDKPLVFELKRGRLSDLALEAFQGLG